MTAFEKTSPDLKEILSKPIRELGLKLEGSSVERFVQQLYRELEAKGLRKFRPLVYLSDEWGCPDEEPVIGVPFYLADPKLQKLEREMNDLEDARQIMMYMRHEAGHAFNYAYELYRTPEWHDLFGSFRKAYRDNYKPIPFSRKFVRHMEGWYAQKHPDEDFAETFAVWMTPRSNWRNRYKGWGAMKKLAYMERTGKKFADVEPSRPKGDTDITVEQMEDTVQQFYESHATEPREAAELLLDTDLKDIFNVSSRKRKDVRPAVDLLRENRKTITDKLTYWTGVQRPLIKNLLAAIEDRLAFLRLQSDLKCEQQYLTELTVFCTTLTMNYLTRGKFVQS
ncbi:MAG: putative zinc-binding metallopeptidase [Terriglobales bacterium]